MKDKLKSYSFWVSILGAIGICIQSVLKEFGICFDQQALDSVITSICSLLVVFGVCTTKPAAAPSQSQDDTTNQ